MEEIVGPLMTETLAELSRRPTREQYAALEKERARLQDMVDFFQAEATKRMKLL